MDEKVKSIHEAIALLNSGKIFSQRTPTPPPPPKIQNVIQSSEEKNAGISLLVSMTYQSLSGNMKKRDILIRRVIQNKNEIYLDGVAMDIRAPRLIKVANIREIQDVTSGRTYDNPLEFIQSRLGVPLKQEPEEPQKQKNEIGAVIERVGHEMTALMYLVAIDGHRDKVEREKVFQYVKSRTTDLSYSDDDLNEYLISLAPDEECFADALERVLKKDQNTVQHFVEAILDIIMADGKVDDKERSFLIKIMDLLEQDGYDISLPI